MSETKTATQQALELKQQILSAAIRGQRFIKRSWIERQVPVQGERRDEVIEAIVKYAESQDVEVK